MRTIQIEFKNEKRRSYQLYNWIALFFSVGGFGLFLFSPDLFVGSLSALILIGVYLLLRYYAVRKKKASFFFDSKGYFYFLLGMLFIGVQMYILTAISMAFGVMYVLAMQNIIFLFNQEGITRKNFPTRHIDWSNVDHVILKDSVLTIDFKNNRIIQGEIVPSNNLNESDFNAFVKGFLIEAQDTAVL